MSIFSSFHKKHSVWFPLGWNYTITTQYTHSINWMKRWPHRTIRALMTFFQQWETSTSCSVRFFFLMTFWREGNITAEFTEISLSVHNGFTYFSLTIISTPVDTTFAWVFEYLQVEDWPDRCGHMLHAATGVRTWFTPTERSLESSARFEGNKSEIKVGCWRSREGNVFAILSWAEWDLSVLSQRWISQPEMRWGLR